MFYGDGSPYAGHSLVYRPESVPIAAIVLLEQSSVNNAPIPLRISAPRFFPQLSLCRLPHTGGARKQNPFPLIRNHRTMEQKNITAKQNLLNVNQMTAMQNSNRQFRNKTNRNLGKSNIKNVPMSLTTQSLRSTQK